jgi:spore coat protein U-like protein
LSGANLTISPQINQPSISKVVNKYSVLSVITGFAVVMSGMTSAMAGTKRGTVTVGASTMAVCTAPGTYNITLGNYNGTLAVTGSAGIMFKCTKTTPFTITLKPNQGRVGSTNGTLNTTPVNATPIAYTLDTDIFTGTGNGLSLSGAQVGGTPNVTVAAGQSPIPGTYSDIITIEVTY